MKNNQKIDREAVTSDANGILKDFIETAKAAGVKVFTDNEREALRKKTIANLAPSDDLWVFAYGSLIWNPVIHYLEERCATANGWHRDFCIHLPIGRGTVDNPGLMLGLKRGGQCKGKVYRIACVDVESETTVLWRREVNTDIYIPKWIDIETELGNVKALAFVVDVQHERYRNISSLEKKAAILNTATGNLGSNKEYLLNTIMALAEVEIQDPMLEELASMVKKLD